MDDFDRALQAALEGDIGLLLGDNADTWWSFVEERVMLGADQLMLRVDMEDESIGPWCIWVVLDVVDSDDLTLGRYSCPITRITQIPRWRFPTGMNRCPTLWLGNT